MSTSITKHTVIPAQAGIYLSVCTAAGEKNWIPAYGHPKKCEHFFGNPVAGMTNKKSKAVQ